MNNARTVQRPVALAHGGRSVLVMVAGTADRSEQLRIVDGSTPEDVTWAKARVRQWRHGSAPGHGGWGRSDGGILEATFLVNVGFFGELYGNGSCHSDVAPIFESTTVLEHPRGPHAFFLLR